MGSLWSDDDDSAILYDKWSMIIFSIIFLFIHVCFGVWLFTAYKAIRKLKRSELNFKKKDKDILFNF